MKQLFKEIEKAINSGKNLVLASVIASSGSTPRGTGAKMIVYEDGSTFGTIGGGYVEYVSIKTAKELHATKESCIKGYCLAPNEVADLGMICGGDVTVYFQYFSADDTKTLELVQYINNIMEKNCDLWLITEINSGKLQRIGTYDNKNGISFIDDMDEEELKPYFKTCAVLKKGEITYYIEPISQSGIVYVFGGGHVSQELVPVLSHIGFRVMVYEDREKFTDIALFPGACGTILGDFHSIREKINFTSSDYVVIVTRGHQGDYIVLENALRTPAMYIGLIGSSKKMKSTVERLHAAGIEDKDIARIHNPIGMDIKAETPAEIAISIAGELILHRAKRWS